MRLTTVILIASLMQVSAATFGQRITISQKNTPLKTVLRELTRQSGYDFVYNGRAVGADQKVTVSLSNAEFDEALKSVLTGLNLSYKIDGKIVSIRKVDEPSLIDRITARFQVVDVRGKIMDEKNQPLAGASVTVKGKSQGTKTDAQGNFYFANVDEKAMLMISFVGYKTMEVVAKEDLGILTLKLEDNSLEQVQVIAYGKVQKKFATSNIGSISSETILRQPISNPILALQGRVPGLFIQSNSGVNVGAVNVTVQGRNSLKNGNVPFYVIDGVPYTPNALGSNVKGLIGAGSPSNLNFINPADIESIEVLKDADATAIYGSRAANGAILITTKKGKAGQTKVDLNLQSGWGKVDRRVKLLDGPDYLAMRRETFVNGNMLPGPGDYDINGVWDTTRNVDWQKELLGGTAQYQNLQASISGGSERTQFIAGAGYFRETTAFSGDFSNIKTSIHFNINHASANQKFRFFLSGSYLHGNNRLPQSDPTSNAIILPPNAPALYNPDGSLNWGKNPTNPNEYTFMNPAATLLERYQDKTNNLIGNSQISYEILSGLKLKSSFGYNRLESDELSMTPLASISPANFARIRSAKYGDRSITSWIIEPQLTLNKVYTWGTIDGLIGGSFQNTDNYVLGLEGSDYTNDAQLPNYNAAGKKAVISSLQSKYRYSAFFGRFNYRLNDRYIVNISARRDGSSRFGSENLFHSFYSVGGAWLFSEEDGIKKLLPKMNYGKLRATYGTTGNDQIPDYYYYSLYDNYGVTVPYQSTVGLIANRLPNAYLQWEETRKLNFGVDLGFFDSRILLAANYFRNRSSNQLLIQNLSIVTGFGSLVRNLPALVQNTGWEFMLDYTPVKTSKFTWRGSANITIPKNELIRYDGLENTSDKDLYEIGRSTNIKRTFKYAGVDSETGLYRFINAKGEMTSTPSEVTDRTVIVDLDVKFYGGFDNTFSYKGFDLNLFFQFTKQKQPSNRFGNFPGVLMEQQPAVLANRWHKPGDQAQIQKVTWNVGEMYEPLVAATNSDEVYSDAAYIRLKNASLSYTFNPNFIKRASLANARLFIQGQNLLTFTKYFGGGDPETVSGNIGTLRMITIGTQLTF